MLVLETSYTETQYLLQYTDKSHFIEIHETAQFFILTYTHLRNTPCNHVFCKVSAVRKC